MRTSESVATPDQLLKARKGRVDFVDVPELTFLMIDGHGAPGDTAFTDALQALYSVSYTAHFDLKHRTGAAPRVMPLEGLWWVDDLDAIELFQRVARGEATPADSDRDLWQWTLMIMQLAPIDGDVIHAAIEHVKDKPGDRDLDGLRFERFTEGPSAQTLHVGPYSAEATTIVAIHDAIAARGVVPSGRHHEIYLGDPRRCAPERLRTILRQPVDRMPEPS